MIQQSAPRNVLANWVIGTLKDPVIWVFIESSLESLDHSINMLRTILEDQELTRAARKEKKQELISRIFMQLLISSKAWLDMLRGFEGHYTCVGCWSVEDEGINETMNATRSAFATEVTFGVRSPQKQKTPQQQLDAKIPKRRNRGRSRKNWNDAIPAKTGVGAVCLPPKTAPPLIGVTENRLTAPAKHAADLLTPLKDATLSRAKRKTGSPRRPEKPSEITWRPPASNRR